MKGDSELCPQGLVLVVRKRRHKSDSFPDFVITIGSRGRTFRLEALFQVGIGQINRHRGVSVLNEPPNSTPPPRIFIPLLLRFASASAPRGRPARPPRPPRPRS